METLNIGPVYRHVLQLQNDAQVYNTVIRIYYQALQTLLVICYQDKMG
jgi:hypothetical protein